MSKDRGFTPPLRARAGFTLMEIMLVVIIIGIFSAMVVPRLAGRSEQARVAAARTDVESNISIALDLYELDNGTYPRDLNALRENIDGANNWKGPYLKRLPRDPWGRHYAYRFPGAHNKDSYDLYSPGRDGAEGTDDDIKNWD